MRCPKCHAERDGILLDSPCHACNYEWWDTYAYVKMLADPIPDIKTVLDIGCGNKGFIAQHYWEQVRNIDRGYACDIHVIKPAPALWVPLLIDAENLDDELEIDFVTHCGFLEHVEYAKALRILAKLETITQKACFITCSAVLREVDFKAKQDGNVHHKYRSWWDAAVFEALGYTVDRERMSTEKTFTEEVTCWFHKDKPPVGGWDATRQIRFDSALDVLAARECSIEGCDCEPVCWDPRSNKRACIHHYRDIQPPGKHPGAVLERWLARADFEATFPHPPGREPRPAK